MSRDTRPRRRQETLDPEQSRDAQGAPGADSAESWKSAWQVSPSRQRHRAVENFAVENFAGENFGGKNFGAASADGQRYLFDLPDAADRREEEPERWDGLS